MTVLLLSSTLLVVVVSIEKGTVVSAVPVIVGCSPLFVTIGPVVLHTQKVETPQNAETGFVGVDLQM